uniref:Calnexin n=1 Tax=Mesocestoides corti TaxID=53468 RepID=A0A5K3FX36_MESCO
MVVTGFVFVLLLVNGLSSAEKDTNVLPSDNGGASLNAGDKENKVVFEPPIIPDDALLSMYFTAPEDIKKLVLSSATKDGVDPDLSKYDGKWSIEVPKLSSVENDYALILKSEGKHHAISMDLGHDFKFDKNEFVVQYEVRFMDGQTCGGAYIKLLSASPDLNLNKFNDKTPYTIMFGPDKCGMHTKLHFIFRHKNPKTGEIQEKHMNPPVASLESIFTDKKTHLFTLVIRSDNSFEVYVDQAVVKSGSLLSEFVPPVNPPAEIDDPNDKKPESWDEREKIPDPDAKKPDDWDESAPQFIVDADAVMPDGWLLDTPKLIPDPNAEKPVDWNTETDGDWEPPMVDNPACESAPGCGPWEKPSKLNPNFKGKWTPPMIPNPMYNGIWKPKKIANPDYFEDTKPFRMIPIRALGLELWSMTAEISFDNFYVGTSKKGADDFAALTWAIKQKAEKDSGIGGKSVLDAIREMSSENPWYVVLGVTASVLPLALVIYFCCRTPASVDAARHKKTDEPVPDSKSDDSDAAVSSHKETEAENSESDDSKEVEEVGRADEDEGKEDEEREENGDDDEEEDKEEEKEMHKKSSARQRTRKE